MLLLAFETLTWLLTITTLCNVYLLLVHVHTLYIQWYLIPQYT